MAEIIKDKDRQQIRQLFRELDQPVKMVMFTQKTECDSCAVTRRLVEELGALSDKLQVEVHDFVKDEDVAKQYRVDKIPAVVLLGDKDYGVRFYGVPSGYEFATLLEDIVDVSKRDPGLSSEVMSMLEKVDKPVHMQAMVSPTCPYCPQAVRTAHKFAMASEHITGDMVDVTEYPHLAVKYNVQGVPNTIINEDFNIVGGQAELAFAQKILEAIGK